MLISSASSVIFVPLLQKQLLHVFSTDSAADNYNIFDEFQCGFHKHHSTETDPLKVTKEIVLPSDAGTCSVPVLPDLSAAFHTVDHILLERLKHWAGIEETAEEKKSNTIARATKPQSD